MPQRPVVSADEREVLDPSERAGQVTLVVTGLEADIEFGHQEQHHQQEHEEDQIESCVRPLSTGVGGVGECRGNGA